MYASTFISAYTIDSNLEPICVQLIPSRPSTKMLALVLVTLATAVAYFLLKLNYSYWEKRGVLGPQPLPILGNLGKSFLFLEQLGNVYSRIYNKYQNEEVVGVYRSTTPVLLARDPEFIKEVVVKSFSSFHDNDIYLDKKNDAIMGRNPLMLKGEEWKTVRAHLTPGFTSGKMKWLYPLLEETSENLVKFINNHPETTNGQGYEAKEMCVRFTLNNVASCAFGIQGNCLEQEESEFRTIAREFFSPDGWSLFSFFIVFLYPSVSKVLPLRIVTKKIEEKLINLVTTTLKYREENNVQRNDFLHILNQFKTSSKDYAFTNLDVTAHAAGFFGDGAETSSIVMCFTLYEIANNPEVQDRLRADINNIFDENGQKPPYEALQSLELLEASIQETLRIHPPMFFLQRLCTQNFDYTLKNGKRLTIEKNTPIILPVYGLHHDGSYWPEPDKFKPERFFDENKESLTKFTYMPFGEGPRQCLGRRFGMLQVKIGIAYILRNYEVSVNKKTQRPIKYANSLFTLAEGGLWLDFKKISL